MKRSRSTRDNHSQDAILSCLECPVCSENPMLPPIRQCVNGHVLCNLCSSRCEACPQCRAHPTNIRNLALEKMAAGLVLRCANFAEGCHVEVKYAEVQKHGATCEFNRILCPSALQGMLLCEEMLRMRPQSLLEHLERKHQIQVMGDASAASGGCIVEQTELWGTEVSPMADTLVSAHGAHFLIRFGGADGHFYSMVQCLDTTTRSRQFDYRIRISQGRLAVQWDSPTQSVSLAPAALLRERLCLWLPRPLARRLGEHAEGDHGRFSLTLHVQIAFSGRLP